MSPDHGWRHSDESRAKMTAARTGKHHSPETRAKISASNVGKHDKEISAAERAAVSAANKDRPFTIEHADKISDAHILYNERTNPPSSEAERQQRESRRLCKRALRARRRAAKS